MKTLVKKHMVWLFALVLTVATMSFKMVEKSEASGYWFLVENGYEIGDPTSPPSGTGTCTYTHEDDICKVQLSTNTPPSTIQDARDEFVFMSAVSTDPF